MNEEVKKLLNEPTNKELYSAYLYLSMADYYDYNNLDGFANWFYIQAQEEVDHAMLIRRYLLNNGEAIELEAIQKPDLVFNSYKEPLVGAYEHELLVTASINNIYDKAASVKDYRTMQFLDWFIQEQMEEEKNIDELISKYELYAEESWCLYQLNQEFAARVYAPPTLVLD